MSEEANRWEQRVLLVNRRKEIATGMDGALDPWLSELEVVTKLNVSTRIPIAPTREAHVALLVMARDLVDEQIAMVMKGDGAADAEGT